ncbi:hypothetical protein BGZ76_002428 [Entomortierella beljakovae]|nr:hypothetical protein BGZ76_002428 [Entomortierella beljakovae]
MRFWILITAAIGFCYAVLANSSTSTNQTKVPNYYGYSFNGTGYELLKSPIPTTGRVPHHWLSPGYPRKKSSNNGTTGPPRNGCDSTTVYKYKIISTMLWEGSSRDLVGKFDPQSSTLNCPSGCTFTDVKAVTKAVMGKIDVKSGFDVGLAKGDVTVGGSVTYTSSSSSAHSMSMGANTRGYQGFMQSWLDVIGEFRVVEVYCCNGNRCSESTILKYPYHLSYPRTTSDGGLSRGTYSICTGEHDNQECYMGGFDITKCKGSDTKIAGTKLVENEGLWSGNGRFRFKIQGDGNGCICDNVSGTCINYWCTMKLPAAGSGPHYGQLQADGNFCSYNGRGNNYGCTGSDQIANNGYRLIMQNDGNLVIYNHLDNPIWHSGTPKFEIPFPRCGQNHGSGGGDSGKCRGGNPGSKNGLGKDGTCCKTEADCKECCSKDGMCNSACNF